MYSRWHSYLLLHIFNSIPNCYCIYLYFTPSSATFWGLWDDASLRRIICIREKSHVNALRIIGASRDAEDQVMLRKELPKMTAVQREQRNKECLLTVAVASTGVINVYTIDTFEVKGVRTCQMVCMT